MIGAFAMIVFGESVYHPTGQGKEGAHHHKTLALEEKVSPGSQLVINVCLPAPKPGTSAVPDLPAKERSALPARPRPAVPSELDPKFLDLDFIQTLQAGTRSKFSL